MSIERLMMQSERVSGKGSEITVIDPRFYETFFEELKARSDINIAIRAFLAVAVSGGCRVSEALGIKVCDIDDQGNFKVRVLKKRKEEPIYRPCKLHPAAHEIVREYIRTKKLRYLAYLFSFSRSYVHRQIKKLFGEGACTHTARHSHFSWLLFTQKLSIMEVATEMKVRPHVVEQYAHLNVQVKQSERYRKAA
jgi:integrase